MGSLFDRRGFGMMNLAKAEQKIGSFGLLLPFIPRLRPEAGGIIARG